LSSDIDASEVVRKALYAGSSLARQSGQAAVPTDFDSVTILDRDFEQFAGPPHMPGTTGLATARINGGPGNAYARGQGTVDYGKDTTLTSAFATPEGCWVRIAIEQKIDDASGWSKVYMDGQLVAQGSGDTATPYPVTRMRVGLVAIDANAQTRPLTLYLDDVRVSVAR
jgi:hypothetical protein